MGGGGNNLDFWGEVMWIIAAFIAAMIAVGVVLVGLGMGWL